MAVAISSTKTPPQPPLTVWRICIRRYADLDGEGARLYGGRWNRAGVRLVYTSESLSLAALESFVNLDTDLAPDDLVSVRVRIPESLSIERLAVEDLPADWRSYPAPLALQALGSGWAKRGDTAVLAVPSAVIPQEWNYLLNPEHGDFARISAAKPRPFSFDPRMWK